MERVIWSKCDANNWCPFMGMNLKHKSFEGLEGIYVIWYENVVVAVGQGAIRERLQAHLHDKEFQAFRSKYLLVTWCTISQYIRAGAVKFLCEQYHPLLRGLCPDVPPIPVNLPFSKRSIYLYGSPRGS